jgi:formate dehydrogenase major subunit
VKKARPRKARPAVGEGRIEVKRTVCSHCSVGCAIDAVVENGVWVRQEPVFDSPINLGAHCAKGAAIREHGHGEFRLRYPMKLVAGKYQRISWDQALNEISGKIEDLRKASGPESVFWIGSSKHSNEQSYLMRKFVSLWGSNNCDHQARICHSTTVAGVANTWGYGAMTNSYNDMQNSKAALYIGSNAAEAHPVSMLHMLHAKENGTKMIGGDPRFTRTAAKADQYIRFRSGSDIPFLFGVLYHIFKNGWEDKKYLNDRVYGMDKVREDVLAKWTPDKVQEACGVPEAEVFKVAQTMAMNRPSTIVWCMGQTQHSIGNAMVRASCILQLALGNIGVAGGGANIFRGHDNVQGATDVGPNPDSLPGYYGIAEGLLAPLRQGLERRLRLDQGPLPERRDDDQARHDGVALDRRRAGEEREPRPGPEPARRLLLGPRAELADRGLEMKRAMDKLDLLVVVDPYPSATAAMAAMPGDPKDLNAEPRGVPAAGGHPVRDQRLLHGVQPLAAVAREGDRAAVGKPQRPHDHVPAGAEARLRQELVKNYKMQKVKGMDEPLPEDILREINSRTGPSATPARAPSG